MLKVIAVYDVKAAAYSAPKFIPTIGLAVRAFTDVCADPSSPMAQYPADFSLRELGTFDPATGKLVSHPEPIMILEASAVVAQRAEDRLKREPLLPLAEVSK